MNAIDTTPANELITAKDVADLLKMKPSTVLDRWRSLGLPAPISLGEGPKAAKRWLRGEVLAYIESRIKRRDTQERVVDIETARHRETRRRA